MARWPRISVTTVGRRLDRRGQWVPPDRPVARRAFRVPQERSCACPRRFVPRTGQRQQPLRGRPAGRGPHPNDSGTMECWRSAAKMASSARKWSSAMSSTHSTDATKIRSPRARRRAAQAQPLRARDQGRPRRRGLARALRARPRPPARGRGLPAPAAPLPNWPRPAASPSRPASARSSRPSAPPACSACCPGSAPTASTKPSPPPATPAPPRSPRCSPCSPS